MENGRDIFIKGYMSKSASFSTMSNRAAPMASYQVNDLKRSVWSIPTFNDFERGRSLSAITYGMSPGHSQISRNQLALGFSAQAKPTSFLKPAARFMEGAAAATMLGAATHVNPGTLTGMAVLGGIGNAIKGTSVFNSINRR